MAKKIYMLEYDDDLGPEWLCEGNLRACLFSRAYIGKGIEVKVKDITEEIIEKEK